MSEHYCTKETELTDMHSRIIRIDEALRGNGKPGLFTEFAVWKNTVIGLIGLNVIIVTSMIALWLKA